jgi:maleate cis-trans isomerase
VRAGARPAARPSIAHVEAGPPGADAPVLEPLPDPGEEITVTKPPLRLGLLYPGHAAEDDLPWLVDSLFPDGSVVADVVHTSMNEDAHDVDVLLDLGSPERLHEGADTLREHGAAVAMWACTSGSFVFGWEGAQRQAADLAKHFGAPASSTSLGFVAALRALGLRRVAVAATYPEPVTARLVELLGDTGFDVLSAGSQGIVTAAEVGTLDEDALMAFVKAGDQPEAEAVLVPDTALHTARSLQALEEVVGKPVITANQVSVWEALRLARNDVPPRPGFGTLFERAPSSTLAEARR